MVIPSTDQGRVLLRFVQDKVKLRVTLGDGKALEGSADYQQDPAWKSLVRCGVEIVVRNIGVTTEKLCGLRSLMDF